MGKCCICGHQLENDFSCSEYGWGRVEAHIYCSNCGYTVEQSYGPTMEGFFDITRGYKDVDGVYHEKNVKKHKRLRKKAKIKGVPVNPAWIFYI